MFVLPDLWSHGSESTVVKVLTGHLLVLWFMLVGWLQVPHFQVCQAGHGGRGIFEI